MKRIIFLLGLLSLLLPVQARQIKDFFKDMPDSVLPILTHDNRLDLIDFATSKVTGSVKNIFEGSSQMVKLTDTYLQLNETPSTKVEIILLPQQGDTAALICMVKTYLAPILESEVSFYNAKWHHLSATQYLKFPQMKDFLTLPAGQTEEDRKQALQKADVPMIAASLEPADKSLHFTMTCDGGFSEARDEMASFFVKEIVYSWDGKRFVPKF